MNESLPHDRPYKLPDTDFQPAFLEGLLGACITEVFVESEVALSDARIVEHTDRFRLFGLIDIGREFEGMFIETEVVLSPRGAIENIDPPHLGVGYLTFAPGEDWEARGKVRNKDDLLFARVQADSTSYEHLRRSLIEARSQAHVEYRLSMEVVGIYCEWNWRAPLVITRFNILSKTLHPR